MVCILVILISKIQYLFSFLMFLFPFSSTKFTSTSSPHLTTGNKLAMSCLHAKMFTCKYFIQIQLFSVGKGVAIITYHKLNETSNQQLHLSFSYYIKGTKPWQYNTQYGYFGIFNQPEIHKYYMYLDQSTKCINSSIVKQKCTNKL